MVGGATSFERKAKLVYRNSTCGILRLTNFEDFQRRRRVRGDRDKPIFSRLVASTNMDGYVRSSMSVVRLYERRELEIVTADI